MHDLVQRAARAATPADYTAADIEVLEGLEPVRRRPGMYIGGTDERALHHLVAEVLDNAMDEAVAGHASWIELKLEADGAITVRDNGRGIPIDPHPKFPDSSALEVIMTTLHSGGKFGGKVYETSGGLHGVGVSVVNALAEELVVEVARNRELWRQRYARGLPASRLERVGAAPNRRGTTVSFAPTRRSSAEARASGRRCCTGWRAARPICSAASRSAGAAIPELLAGTDVPAREVFHFPAGLADFLKALLAGARLRHGAPFIGEAELGNGGGRVEWAIAWPLDEEPYTGCYCNTVPTPLGGTHEQALRNALLRALRAYAELTGAPRRSPRSPPTTCSAAPACCSRCSSRTRSSRARPRTGWSRPRPAARSRPASRTTSTSGCRSHGEAGRALLEHVRGRAEERLARKRAKEVARKTATRKLRLPGKLADCSIDGREGTEIFLVEGDSAGGSAKQARNRETQAILPLRGKILNAVSATADKLRANKELADLVTALGCGHGKALSRRRPALRQGRHHDRRRRRRRPHRGAADDLLLPRDAQADRGGPPLPRAAAALPAERRRRDRLRPRRGRPRAAARRRASRARRSRSAASRAWARWPHGSCARPPWTRRPACSSRSRIEAGDGRARRASWSRS